MMPARRPRRPAGSGRRAAMNFPLTGSVVLVPALLPSKAETMSGNPVLPCEQADRDLRLQAPLLGEAGLAEPVALVGLEVERGRRRGAPDSSRGRSESCLLVGSIILASTSCRNVSSCPVAAGTRARHNRQSSRQQPYGRADPAPVIQVRYYAGSIKLTNNYKFLEFLYSRSKLPIIITEFRYLLLVARVGCRNGWTSGPSVLPSAPSSLRSASAC